MICKECSSYFMPSVKRLNCKNNNFCSKRCREKNWIANNHTRYRDHQKKYRDKHTRPCKWCNTAIQVGSTRSSYCSQDCAYKFLRQQDKKRSAARQALFNTFKLSIGCQICSYKRHAGSLDFHHIDPSIKSFRIYADNYLKEKEELEKCILLCKNCHYEVHHGFTQLPT